MRVEELFVEIPYFTDYAVSNYGVVLNVKTGIEVHQWALTREGRLKVRIPVRAAYADFYVESLVAEAFFVDYEPGIDIYYKNGNKLDCTVLNLTFIKPESDDGEEKG